MGTSAYKFDLGAYFDKNDLTRPMEVVLERVKGGIYKISMIQPTQKGYGGTFTETHLFEVRENQISRKDKEFIVKKFVKTASARKEKMYIIDTSKVSVISGNVKKEIEILGDYIQKKALTLEEPPKPKKRKLWPVLVFGTALGTIGTLAVQQCDFLQPVENAINNAAEKIGLYSPSVDKSQFE